MDPSILEKRIREKAPLLGNSASGQNWCLRALHPAHPSGEFHGIPDKCCMPTVQLEFKMTFSIPQPVAPGPTYRAWLGVMPNVVAPMVCLSVNTDGTGVVDSWFSNPQITGATIANKTDAWRANVASARLEYMSVTVFYDAPTLYDQGVKVAAQVGQSWNQDNNATPPQYNWNGVLFTPESLVNYPLATQTPGREGAYMPIKLSQPTLPFLEQQLIIQYRPSFVLSAAETARLPRMLDGMMGGILFSNISAQAQLRATIRMGVECLVSPGSLYTPFQEPSNPPDEVALTSYYTVSGVMDDCFPSSYNDWDNMWRAIKDAARKILPFASGIVGTIPGVGKGLSWAADALQKKLEADVTRKGPKPPPRRRNRRRRAGPPPPPRPPPMPRAIASRFKRTKKKKR